MNSRIGVSLFFWALVAYGSGARASICRVAADGLVASDGSSWALSTTLHSALANGNGKSCDEIWVKRGVYLPYQGTIDAAARQVSFEIARPLKLYGGFAGTETLLSQRTLATLAANSTVLSGDIDGNDLDNDGNQIDETAADIQGSNSFHVIVVGGGTGTDGNGSYTESNTTIDGFIVTGGDATIAPSPAGGGLFCNGRGSGKPCSPTIANCAFQGNRAGYGGALYALGYTGVSSPVFVDVIFGGNHAAVGGGAIFNEGNSGISSPRLERVALHDNTAGDGLDGQGGAMFNNGYNAGDSSPSLRRVTFSGNSATSSGGGMFNNADYGIASPKLVDVTFHGNAAPRGGAFYDNSNWGQAYPTLYRVTFSSNTAAEKGGALYVRYTDNDSYPYLTNVTFFGNHASDGGAIYTVSDYGNGHALLQHVTFSNNSASGKAGAWYMECGPMVANCYGTSGSVVDTIFVDDSAPQNPVVFVAQKTAGIVLQYGVVYDTNAGSGSCPSSSCAQMQYGDPKLGDLADNGGFTLTMLPGAGSAAIDTGSPQLMVVDQRGVTRPQGAGMDIGSVEVSVSIFFDNFEEPCFPTYC